MICQRWLASAENGSEMVPLRRGSRVVTAAVIGLGGLFGVRRVLERHRGTGETAGIPNRGLRGPTELRRAIVGRR